MAPIAGKYQHVKNENLKEFIVAVSSNEAFSVKADEVTSTIDIKVDGNNYTVSNTLPNRVISISFTPGKEFVEDFGDGKSLDSTVSVDGSKLVFVSKKGGNEVGGRVYEFTDSELIITMTAKNTPIAAKRFYKRV